MKLFELIQKETEKNLVKKPKVESINRAILELLYNQGKKLTRIELVQHITERRIKQLHTEEELEKIEKPELLKLINKVSRTVKNGVDQSISRANNNASFHYNEEFSDYKLELNKGLYQVLKVK